MNQNVYKKVVLWVGQHKITRTGKRKRMRNLLKSKRRSTGKRKEKLNSDHVSQMR